MGLNKRPITADDLKRISVVGDPQISPDGERYAYVQTHIDENEEYRSHLYIHTLGDDIPVQWTFGKVKDQSPRWSPDGSEMVFSSNRSGTSQLWIMSTSGGEARQLTTLKNGAHSPVWSPNGRYILFSTLMDPDGVPEEETKEDGSKKQKPKPLVVERLKYKSDMRGFHDEKRNHLALYDLKAQKVIQLTSGQFDHTPGSWSPDSKHVVFTANRETDEDRTLHQDLFTIDIESREVTKLTDTTGAFSLPNWSPDGQKIACFGHQYEFKGATLNQVWIIDVDTKEKTCMTLKWDVQIGDAMIGDIRSNSPNPGPVWSLEQEYIYFTASDHGNTGLYQMDMEGEITTIHEEENHVFGFTYHRNTDRFIAGISDPSNPGDFFKIRRNERGKIRLTDVNEKFLREVHLSIPEPVTTKAEDGWEIHGWIMKPADFEDGKKYPLVLEIHGGPHAMYGNTFFHELQLLAAQGYVVLYTNPRGSHGYGQTFVNACRGDYGGRDYTDLMSAVDHVLENFDCIDQERLGVTGGSYGGFMTNWIVSHTDRFKAAVTQRSISNWLSFYGVSDIGYFFTEWEIGYHLFDDPEKLWHHSPLRYVKNVNTPLLILHGEQDYRCPIEQGEQLFIALKHLEKEVKFVRFPEANHELSRSGPPTLRLERLNHICKWFKQYI
ncbi:S9 family peptidase [Thalassorhabdus alkalitolerans]|uniref:S9 family peptidase n=1 Tax=Thalassorhabdus alkalitolerans TaxID=2282697 RepID=A0ABW0YRX9_9BACI